jgi:hypothetical protein
MSAVPSTLMYNLTSTLICVTPIAKTGPFDTAMLAAWPSDAPTPTFEIDETGPTPDGGVNTSAKLTATMSQDDLGMFVNAMIAAMKGASAVLQSITLSAAVVVPVAPPSA